VYYTGKRDILFVAEKKQKAFAMPVRYNFILTFASEKNSSDIISESNSFSDPRNGGARFV